jgi:peptide/nickel transport system substrate-binding protein
MKFQAYTPKEKIEFVRNEDYNWAPDIWGHTGPAYLEKFTVIVADEPAARVTALESGDATAIEDTPGQDVARLQADSRFQLIKGEIPGHPRGFFQNTERAPLDDLNVRKALETGINREEVVQLATFGTQPMSPGPFSPPTPGHSDKADNFYPFDAAKAGEMLDAAGWTLGADGIRAKGGEQLTLKTIGFAVFRALYEASQSNLRQIGVNLDLQILDTAAAVEANHRGDHHWAMTGVVASDPSNIALLYHSRNYNGYDWSRVQDPAFDKMWDDAASELDRDKRLKQYEDIQLYIMENALNVPMQAIVRNNFYAAEIKDVKPDARGIYLWWYDTYIEG